MELYRLLLLLWQVCSSIESAMVYWYKFRTCRIDKVTVGIQTAVDIREQGIQTDDLSTAYWNLRLGDGRRIGAERLPSRV